MLRFDQAAETRQFLLVVLVFALAVSAASCGESGPSGPNAKAVEEFEDFGLVQEEAEAEVVAAHRAAARKARKAGKAEKQLQRELREEKAMEGQQAPKADSVPQPEPASGGFTGVHASNYEAAMEICSAFPRSQIARELGLPASADEFDIAEAYADGYTDRFRQAGFEGCIDGLLG
jgi:hypothetical protein